MTKELPTKGGSYVRKSSGKLDRKEATKQAEPKQPAPQTEPKQPEAEGQT
ncbi:hypothetical protein K3727_09470 [Rhodobacteraceae bacterium M382]|nr:hypothetical protein K3727_09470 [Rhodobacteraceae bacterium M382]